MDEDEDTKLLEFHEMGLDDRILKAISKLGWSSPTPIQERSIPLALEGKDILAQARTGSGKTGAFVIPVIQKILASKQTATQQCVKAIILTPTKELCSQAYKNVLELTSSCSREVRCVDISPQVPLPTQRPMLSEKPDIVICTPSRLLAHIQAGNINVKQSLEMIVIDEADLVFSFGYEENVKAILSHMPKIYQAFLMSATLGEDVKALKKMVLHNAVILKLNETQLPEASKLTQYHIKCNESDKFALIYALLKLRLVRGKSIFFVNNVDRCYKLRLFLEQFGIPACVLNSELPVNSRCHIVSQFNDGLYDYIIASDETLLTDPQSKKTDSDNKRERKKDKEFNVSRGLDFQHVSNVINFDFPTTVDSYIHRVGRTARGDSKGTALSFVSIKEMSRLEEVEKHLIETSGQDATVFKPYQFKMEEIEGFKYRAKDAMQAVTRVAIREARLKEIKQELLNSQKLKSHFEDNPRDLQLLRHDKNLHTVKSHEHMKHVPEYLVPQTLQKLTGKGKQRNQHSGKKRGFKPKQSKHVKRMADPLRSFQHNPITDKKKTSMKTVKKKGKS
ncbi:putative ATP-dependent RNA helicase ddx56 [Mactra antiquata]